MKELQVKEKEGFVIVSVKDDVSLLNVIEKLIKLD